MVHNSQDPTELNHRENCNNVHCFQGRQQCTILILKYHGRVAVSLCQDLGAAIKPKAGREEGGLSPANVFDAWRAA
jgi:hypothetical protein